MEQELQKQSVLIAGLIAETNAQTLALKALIKKTSLTKQEVLSELKISQLNNLPFLERNMIVSSINDLFS